MPGEDFSKGISGAQAEALLRQDARRAVSEVNAGLKVPVSRNQFDALVDLTYNEGPRSVLPEKEMMRAVSAGHVAEPNFTAYRLVKRHGRYAASPGPLNRRREEYRLYSKSIY